MKTGIKVWRGLQSFLTEIGRWSRAGFHYNVNFKDNQIEIIHHNGKWLVRIQKSRITVYTDDDILVVTKSSLVLNNEEVSAICDIKCYDKDEIINKVIFAVLLYSCQVPEWLYEWIS